MRRPGPAPSSSGTTAASGTPVASGAPVPGPARSDRAARPAVPTAVVAAGSLVAGFAVAQATDVRALGGVVLLAGALWCGRHWVRRQPTTGALLLLGYAGGFVGSHVLARGIGAWPAVITMAGAVGAAAWVASDRRG